MWRRVCREVIAPSVASAIAVDMAAVLENIFDDAKTRAATAVALARHLVRVGVLREHIAQLAFLPAAADVVARHDQKNVLLNDSIHIPLIPAGMFLPDHLPIGAYR